MATTTTEQVGAENQVHPRLAAVEEASDATWQCRTCQTVNMAGWQVCRACSSGRPLRGDWLRSGPFKRLLLFLGSVGVSFVGLVTMNAWAVMVGGGVWLVPAAMLWLLTVALGLIVAWQRAR
ncbi:MAG TPA: hypothetical protein DGO43_03830 [Chloroflexi bacterium]|nr:hypothetical protein [Chloroflexota bacterium]